MCITKDLRCETYINLHIDNVSEVSWFLQVVESLHLHELSDDLVSHLVTPLIDDWHVDVIYEYCHLLTSRWSVCCTHTLIYITLYCSLRGKVGNTQ